MLSATLKATRQLSELASAVAENHEERIQHLTRLAEHNSGCLDRTEHILETMAGRLETLRTLIEQFVRGQRGNGHSD
jgi:hypothetical protein